MFGVSRPLTTIMKLNRVFWCWSVFARVRKSHKTRMLHDFFTNSLAQLECASSCVVWDLIL